jgi:predicted permease
LTFRDWRESVETFEDIVSWRLSVLTWTGGDSPELLRGWAVSAGFLPLMGADMTMGRGFTAEEDQPGGTPVVVVSHGFWNRAYGSEPDILGKSMTLDGTSYTIVGVAGPDLGYPSAGDYWVPIGLDYAREFRDFRYLGVVGRLRSGIDRIEAQAELDRLALATAVANPDTNEGWGAEMLTLKEVEVGRVRPALLGMGAAVVILLLIAVGNVTNLTLARAAGRRTDTAIRRALGAGAGTLVRLLLGEALLLSLLGSALGLTLASLGLRVLGSTSLLNLPRVSTIGLAPRDFLFGIGVASLVGLALGGVSVLGSRGVDLTEALRAGGAGGMATARSQRTRELVLAIQVALALMLLIGASVLTRSLLTLSRVDPGFDPAGLLTFSYDLPSTFYPDPESIRDFESAALERINGIPGVDAAGFVTPIPLEMGSVPSSWSLPADVRNPIDGPVMAHMRSASPGYFPAMGLELVTGRLLDAGDRFDSEPVVLVNRTFADRYLSGQNPIGTRITAGELDDEAAEWATIVGIVEDVRFLSLRIEGEPEIYLPISQLPPGWGHLTIRSRLRPEALALSVQEAIQTIDPNLPLSNIRTGDQMIGSQLRTSRLSTLLTSLFALTASALSFVGTLGVLSILVAQRMREIGLRMVLGAGSGSVWGFVLSRGMRPVVIGLALGAALAAGGTRFLESQLFGVSALDPLAFLLPLVGLAIVGSLACLVPGARATATDPVLLLKSE